jgi:hypothetical protein
MDFNFVSCIFLMPIFYVGLLFFSLIILITPFQVIVLYKKSKKEIVEKTKTHLIAVYIFGSMTFVPLFFMKFVTPDIYKIVVESFSKQDISNYLRLFIPVYLFLLIFALLPKILNKNE